MNEPVVILLHGLARTHRSLNGLDAVLRAEGFRTWSATYDSRRQGITQLAADVASRIRSEAPASRYFAVTHSLGGILVRHMRDALPWARVVMLAPPNQGSAIARAFAKNPVFQWFFGPAGREVIDSSLWPDPPDDFAVIAGTKSLALANPTSWVTKSASLFPAGVKSDGTVAVDETKHPKMRAFAEVPATHTFIMNDPRARALALAFLRSGRF